MPKVYDRVLRFLQRILLYVGSAKHSQAGSLACASNNLTRD